jgi:hypothetical protein
VTRVELVEKIAESKEGRNIGKGSQKERERKGKGGGK